MNRDELVSRIAQETGVAKARVETILETASQEIKSAVSRGERVSFSRFGSFSPRYRKPKMIPDVHTGGSKQLDGAYTPVFTPSRDFKNQVKEGLNGREDHCAGG